MTFFDREELVALHQANVERFGGSQALCLMYDRLVHGVWNLINLYYSS